jgi:hypothetical protein
MVTTLVVAAETVVFQLAGVVVLVVAETWLAAALLVAMELLILAQVAVVAVLQLRNKVGLAVRVLLS